MTTCTNCGVPFISPWEKKDHTVESCLQRQLATLRAKLEAVEEQLGTVAELQIQAETAASAARDEFAASRAEVERLQAVLRVIGNTADEALDEIARAALES
jgi:uncharacterized protein (DUF3084 family)